MNEVFDYFEHEGAHFRRAGPMGGVDDVLHGNEWKPYAGNRRDPALYDNKCDDPLAPPSETNKVTPPRPHVARSLP